jgi:hypothetical protein
VDRGWFKLELELLTEGSEAYGIFCISALGAMLILLDAAVCLMFKTILENAPRRE